MNWLDGVMAVPTIGIRLDPNYKEMSDFRQHLESFIEQIRKEYGKINIKSSQIWGYSVETIEEGFQFDLTQNNLIITYAYPINQIPQPGKLPKLLLPKIYTFSELFEKILGYFKDISNKLDRLNDFEFNRIGIVARVGLEMDSLPPGVEKWIDFLGRPWGAKIMRSESKLSVTLKEEKMFYERCHHGLTFDQEDMDKNGINLNLDWQRVFKKPLPMNPRELISQLTECKDNAFEYFQRYGEGDLNYG